MTDQERIALQVRLLEIHEHMLHLFANLAAVQALISAPSRSANPGSERGDEPGAGNGEAK